MTALRYVFGLLCLGAAMAPVNAEPPALEFQGRLITECTLPGETRKDDVVPREGNAMQVSANRWLVSYITHGYRGVDDERSIIYQLRKDRPDGEVIKEGFLVRTQNDWKPEGVPPAPEGTSYVKQHGHVVLCGVPQGAFLDGKIPEHANTFMAMWRVVGRPLIVAEKKLEKTPPDSVLMRKTQGVEWCQFRLNALGDDIEIVQPVRRLRQKGFEQGEAFCEANDVDWMNQSYVPPVPFNSASNEWVVANHFPKGRVAVLKFRFNPETKLYEWVQLGPFVGDLKNFCWESSLLNTGKEWVVANRSSGKVAWAKTLDPFKEWSKPVYGAEPIASAPLTAFTCADGVVRLFTGDRAASAQKYERDPLYCFDVTTDPDFSVANRRVIFDTRAAKLPIRPEVRSKLDFCKLVPLSGNKQLLMFGLSTRAYNFPYAGEPSIPAMNQDEKDVAGIYFATLTYSTPVLPMWAFADEKLR